MMDVKNGAGGCPTSGRNAVEWFVENESDMRLDETGVLEWEEWCTHGWNIAEYLEISQMRMQILALPVPSVSSRDELLRDALEEGGRDS
jgi:hypothetical protein